MWNKLLPSEQASTTEKLKPLKWLLQKWVNFIELVTLHLSWILRFIIEAPYRQIKYDTMQVDKHIPNNNETGAHGQADEISTKTVGIFLVR